MPIRVVEGPRLLGVFGQILEDRFAEEMIERRLAGADAVEQLTPGAIMFLAHHDRHRTLSARRRASQPAGQGRLDERPIRSFAEDADAGEGAQQAVERLGMGAGGAGEILGAFHAALEQIGKAEFGRHVQGLREPVPRQHLVQEFRGREVLSSRGQVGAAHSVPR